jgi:YHS domain-containing protein
MSTISSVESHADVAAVPQKPGVACQNGSPKKNVFSVDRLVQRLSAEVVEATKRVKARQAEAAKVFRGQEQRFMHFMAVADRIQAILEPRLAVLMTLDAFKDIKHSMSLEPRGHDDCASQGRTTTLRVPFSDHCPAKVELSFRLGHDGAVENAILDYRLDILPIFIKFDSHDQLIIPLDLHSEEAIAAWIDDKLLAFTRTYFELSFMDQYQKQNLETDPVMHIRFPRAFAARKKEYQGRTYHFYTHESSDEFDKNPSEYGVTE